MSKRVEGNGIESVGLTGGAAHIVLLEADVIPFGVVEVYIRAHRPRLRRLSFRLQGCQVLLLMQKALFAFRAASLCVCVSMFISVAHK